MRNAIRRILYSYASLLMPHCPVTVVKRYRDGVCSLLFHLFFIICNPHISLHLEHMLFQKQSRDFLITGPEQNSPTRSTKQAQCTVKLVCNVLKCKTLGGIMQVSHSTAPTHIHTQRCVYTAHAPTSASLPRVGFRLCLAFFTPVAPVASL